MLPRWMNRRPRRDVLWFLTGFVICQALLAVTVETWLEQVRDPEFAAKIERLRARRAEQPDRPLILVLGSSRTEYGLAADHIVNPATPLIFNFGAGGSGPLLQQVFLERLLTAGVRPDFVLVEVTPLLLVSCCHHAAEERQLDGARLCGTEVARLMRHYDEPSPLLRSWAVGRLLPCWRHQGELRAGLHLDVAPRGETLNDPTVYIAPLGWKPVSRAAQGLAPVVLKNVMGSEALAPAMVQAQESRLDRIERAHLPCALVVMPESSWFRASYTPALNAAVASLLQRLHQERGLPVINARDWVGDDGFFDGHHMLMSGAIAFSERILGEQILPLWQKVAQSNRRPYEVSRLTPPPR